MRAPTASRGESRAGGVALLLLILVPLPGALAQLCGDCNGDHHVNVVDSLVAAQHDAGLATLTGPDFLACNVDGTPGGPPAGAVTIVDALVIAQGSGGLGGPLTCVTVPGCSIDRPGAPVPTRVLLVSWWAIDAQATPVDMVPEFSTNLGISWHQATQGPGGEG